MPNGAYEARFTGAPLSVPNIARFEGDGKSKKLGEENVCERFIMDATGRFVEHAEFSLNGHSIMYFFFSFDDERSMLNAYEVLKEGAEIRDAPKAWEWCATLPDLTDKYGVRWLLNVF